jgi:hypothetical protein
MDNSVHSGITDVVTLTQHDCINLRGKIMVASMLIGLFGCGQKVIKNVSYELHGSPISVVTTYSDKRIATITDAKVNITLGEDVYNKLI